MIDSCLGKGKRRRERRNEYEITAADHPGVTGGKAIVGEQGFMLEAVS
jgi:hypothetical protein